MIAALLALIVMPQDAPPQDAADPSADVVYDDIVVEATVGRVALLFDQAADGRLQNCRVFVSSGDAEIDATACTDLPDCITDTEGRSFCDGVPEPAPAWDARAVAGMSTTPKPLAIPRLVTPDAPNVPRVGPALHDGEDEDPNRLTKLPPPPRDTSHDGGTSVSFGAMNSLPGDDR